MKHFSIVKYNSNYFNEWNNFVLKAKNATFLFQRDFMEYHSDSFNDYSLLVYKKDKLIGVLPANRIDDTLYSHQGLSYGGYVVSGDLRFQDSLESFKAILKYLNFNGINTLELKQIPSIYCSLPSDEINYFMFLLKAQLIKRDVLSAINLKESVFFSKSRFEGLKRGTKHGLKIKEEIEFSSFWNDILIPNLSSKHNVSPVHSLKEISLLKKRFPKNIRQFNVYYNNTIVAGTTIFETNKVAHCQYISGNNKKNLLGSLDFLHHYLIKEVFCKKLYFDFGNSNENKGENLNKGLQFWKEGFAARSITHDFYSVETRNFIMLEDVMI